MFEFITFLSNYSVHIVGGLVVLILAVMLALSARNPIIAKLGVRNIPRRPAQTGLIVLGLTLSTIIIISSLSIGNTLSYSVREQAISAYGEIDEVLSPPLLATLAGLMQENNEAGPNLAEIQGVLSGDLMSFFRLLRDGLPGIPEERYAALRAEAQEAPLIDGVAPSIIFPTIIRNVTSGQSEPLGFIFGVDGTYTEDFGLHAVTGQPVTTADLDTGVGNIFETAFNLFGQARNTAEESGFEISPSSLTLAGLGAFLGQQGLDPGQLELSSDMVQQFGSFLLSEAEQAEVERLSDLLNPELLSTVNLNTLRSDIDTVLARYGLQLRQGEVYLSRIAAERLEADVGDVVEIHVGPLPVPYRVKGIVEEAGPMSALWPVVVMRLDEAQKLLLMPDRVNNILVSNQGDPQAGLEHTEAVSRQLRTLAVNPAAAEQLLKILRRPPVRDALDQAIAEYTPGPEPAQTGRREEEEPENFNELMQAFEQFESEQVTARNLEILRAELDEPGLSDALRAALADAGVTARLNSLPLEPETQAELEQALQNLSSVTLIRPLSKAAIVSTAEAGSQAFVVVFAIFGIFSVLAGVLLIFMIFVMLAAERRSELGMARTIGMQRGQLVQMFVSEGLVYDLLAAALGVVLGILASYAMVGFIGRLFNDVAGRVSGQSVLFQVSYHIAPASIILAYCLGVLLTFVVVYLASWRVSSLNIVHAMRDLPEADAPRGRRSRLRRWGSLALVLLPVGAGIALLFNGGSGFIQPAASLILVGLALGLGWLLHSRTTLRAERRNRLVYSMIGLGLLGVWIVPWRGLGGVSDLTGAATWFVFSGPLLIVGAILAVIWNARAFLWLVNRLMGRAGSLTPVLKMAIAYPLSARYRTGMAMAMFAIVISTVTVMSVVIEATQTAITPDTEAYAGFEIQPSASLLSFFNPIYDLKTAIAEHPDFPAEQVAAVAQFSNLSAEARMPGDDAWGGVNVIGLNPDYIDQAEQYYRFQARAPDFENDAAVWQALRERDDVAVVTADLVPSAEAERPLFPEPEPGEADEDEPFRRPAPPFTFEALEVSDDTLPAHLTVEIGAARPPEDLSSVVDWLAEGGSFEPREDTPEADRSVYPVQIIGVLAPQNTLAGRGIQTSEAFVAAVTGAPARPDTFYVKVAEGADVRQVARRLESAFASSGLNVTITSEAFAAAQQLTRGILQLFQGFMALGLLVGIAALGVISSRTVVERRQQVGMVRAIGMQASTVALSFLLETSFIALAGITIGVTTGVVLGQRMVGVFFPILTNGASYGLPWLQIGLIVLLAYLASLVTTVLPAYQASRIYPAEALRYE